MGEHALTLAGHTKTPQDGDAVNGASKCDARYQALLWEIFKTRDMIREVDTRIGWKYQEHGFLKIEHGYFIDIARKNSLGQACYDSKATDA